MKQSILVVDDEEMIRKNFCKFLTSAGYNAIIAENGREAMKVLSQFPVNLVITDIYMPEEDGLGVIRNLRKQRPGIPIIAMSGGTPRMPYSMLPAAKFMGADRTFAKPFDPPEVLAAIRELLSHPESGPEAMESSG